MITIETLPGDYFPDVAAKAVAVFARSEGGEPVYFAFNGIKLIVKAGTTAADLCAEYDRALTERSAAYCASPEYAASERKQAEEEAARKAALADALVAAPATPTMTDPVIWQSWIDANKDGYGNAIMTYAARWARVMEGMIAGGATVAGCAKQASHIADEEGITGFMYGAAVGMLAKAWKHGEELRRWHNIDSQIGTEGEKANESGGVLNPALLSIG